MWRICQLWTELNRSVAAIRYKAIFCSQFFLSSFRKVRFHLYEWDCKCKFAIEIGHIYFIYHCSFRARSCAWNRHRSNLLYVDYPIKPMILSVIQSATFDTNRRTWMQSNRSYHRIASNRRCNCRASMWFVHLMRTDIWWCWCCSHRHLKNCYRLIMDGTHRHCVANCLIDVWRAVLCQWTCDNYSFEWVNYLPPNWTTTGDSMMLLSIQDYCYWYDYWVDEAIGQKLRETKQKKKKLINFCENLFVVVFTMRTNAFCMETLREWKWSLTSDFEMKTDVWAAVETVNFSTTQKTDWSAFRHCYCWMYSYSRCSLCVVDLYLLSFEFLPRYCCCVFLRQLFTLSSLIQIPHRNKRFWVSKKKEEGNHTKNHKNVFAVLVIMNWRAKPEEEKEPTKLHKLSPI